MYVFVAKLRVITCTKMFKQHSNHVDTHIKQESIACILICGVNDI